MATEKTVPTYAVDGRRLRSYTLEAIERLLQMDLVAVQRNRAGRIVTAHFRDGEGANPIRATAHLGTKYSFNQHLPSGRTAWKYRALMRDERALAASLGEIADDPVDADLFIRRVFRAVPLSCIKRTSAPESLPAGKQFTGSVKVVSIETARAKRKAPAAARPIEFDSERRVA